MRQRYCQAISTFRKYYDLSSYLKSYDKKENDRASRLDYYLNLIMFSSNQFQYSSLVQRKTERSSLEDINDSKLGKI